jgi:hypothetical protein
VVRPSPGSPESVIDGPGDGVESGTEGSLDGAGDGSGALSAVLLCDGCGVMSSSVLGADDGPSGAAFGARGWLALIRLPSVDAFVGLSGIHTVDPSALV